MAGRHRADNRRPTVDASLPPGSTCRRKRLHSAAEGDEEAAVTWASRSNPEGGSDLPSLCQRCHIVASQLNRQAAALADATALKDPAYASFLFDKLQRLQLPRRGCHTSVDAHCELCGASYQQLRRLALRRALGFSRDMPPRPASPGVRWVGEEQAHEAAWGWAGVQSSYLGGGGAEALATVTPLHVNHLEGVWRVSVRRPGEQHATGLASTKDYVKPPSVVLKPAAHSISTQTSPPPSAAAAFFLRAAQKLRLSHRKKPGPPSSPAEAPRTLLYSGGFSGALQLSPPAVPPCLLRGRSKVKDTPGMGKVRVMVRICSVHRSGTSESMSFLKVEGRKKQLSLCEAAAGGRASAPKTFTFDAVFSQDASQAEVCSGAVAGVIQSVVNGADGCIFSFGHVGLGKTYTMVGRDCSTQSLGVAPTAISWLFKVMEERKEKAGACFSVCVSAVEISGREETLTDLLAEHSHPGPAVSLTEDPICGSQLQNQTEVLVTDAGRAAFFLDAALASRTSSRTPDDQEARRNSHFLFTLHLHQERADKSSKAAISGRSRLHLLDLGSCDAGGGQCLSLSALGNVILALANGAKHIPYRDSKLTMLLSDSLGNINCRSTMIAHISDSPADYTETLTTVQLASRIHRMKRKKSKYASSSSGGDSSCEEGPSHPPHRPSFLPRAVALDPDAPPLLSRDPDYSSSSEHSCDTIIYVGPGGAAISDRELSDNEGPPSFVPIIPSLNKKPVRAAAKADGDHLKCNTFAELQERLDCIDGSVCSASEGKASVRTKPTNAGVFSEHTSSTNQFDDDQVPSAGGLMDTDGDKLSAASLQSCRTLSQDSGPVVREKVHLRAGIPKTPRTAEVAGRTPPVGMGVERAPCTDTCPIELNNLRASLLNTGFLRTTVTLQQPVELNREDELVFTVVEDLPRAGVPDNGRPPNLLGFSGAFRSGTRPVSIISSINDEYDAYMSQQGAEREREVSWPSEDPSQSQQDTPARTLPTMFPKQFSVQHGLKGSLNDSGVCFPELDSDPATPNKTALIKCPPSPDSAQIPLQTTHPSLPRKAKPTSSAAVRRPEARHNDLFQGGEVEVLSIATPPGIGLTSVSSRRPGGNSNSVPQPAKPQMCSSAQRSVGDCDKPGGRRGETLIKLPRLTRGATTLGTVSTPQSPELKGSQDGTGVSMGKKSNGQKNHLISVSGNVSPPTTPRQSSQEQSSPSAFKSPKTEFSEEEFNIRHRADSFRHRTSSLKMEHGSARTSPGLKTRGTKADSPKSFGSLMSLETCDGQSGNKPEQFRDNSRCTRSVPRLGVPASLTSSSNVVPGASATTSKQARGSSTLSSSSFKSFSSCPKTPDYATVRNASLPLAAKAPARPGLRGTIMGTKQAVSRAANCRVSQLGAGSPNKQVTTNHATDSGSPTNTPLPSPYSKITAPRRPQRYSSGHGSDNSSILSGELPPAMGRTALFYHSGGSSGYESMIRDSTSSAHDSMSESGVSTSNKSRVSKSPRKRGNGFQRRRLIPAPLPDSSLARSKEGQWDLKQPFEIKVYEIDDVERLQQRRETVPGPELFHDVEKGLLYFNARLRMLEKRQQRIGELKSKHERLQVELEEAKRRLMLHPSRWSDEFHVDQDLDQDSQEYLEALAQTTAALQYRVDLCKSRVTMETCFDVGATVLQGGQQEPEP